MLKLYWCPRTRAARALWMLEEMGIEYELVHIDVRDAAAKADPEFRAASPMGKVPALIHDEAKLSDSAAICLYLADRFPKTGLAPATDDPMRAKYLYWMTFTPGTLEPALAEKFSGAEPNRYTHGWGDFDSMIETLVGGLSPGPWLLGEKFSAADVMVGSSAYFLKQFEVLPDNDVLEGYVERCLARPAYQRTLAMDAEKSA